MLGPKAHERLLEKVPEFPAPPGAAALFKVIPVT